MDAFSRRLWRLDSEALCARARRRTGLKDFGDPPIEPALSTLVCTLEEEADLHPLGRFLMHGHLLEMLSTRLRLVEAWRVQPQALADSKIERPIFITGMPRSGSTFLHELLAQDHENRSPRVFEVMFPLPLPPSGQRNRDPRVRKAAARLWWFRRIAPEADTVCPIRACTPHECMTIHSFTFLSDEFVSTCRIPSYEKFLYSTDRTPAYAWEKRFLQHLQLGSPVKRWVLKSLDHASALEDLFAVFPDAFIIQTHRDPLEVLRSNSQLTRILQGLYARPADLGQFGANEARELGEKIESIMRFRDHHPEVADRFIDVSYSELASDPSAVVRRIYRHVGSSLNAETTERLRQLISNRSRYRRWHNLTLTDLGLDAQEQSERFNRYCFRFCQQPEAS